MAKNKIPMRKFFMVRGHLHLMQYYSQLNDFEGVFNGCWKLVSPYATSKQPMRFRDLDIGAIDLFLHKDGSIRVVPFRPDIPYQFNNVVDMSAEIKAMRTHKEISKKPYANRQRKRWEEVGGGEKQK